MYLSIFNPANEIVHHWLLPLSTQTMDCLPCKLSNVWLCSNQRSPHTQPQQLHYWIMLCMIHSEVIMRAMGYIITHNIYLKLFTHRTSSIHTTARIRFCGNFTSWLHQDLLKITLQLKSQRGGGLSSTPYAEVHSMAQDLVTFIAHITLQRPTKVARNNSSPATHLTCALQQTQHLYITLNT